MRRHTPSPRLLLVGAGKMGGALLSRWNETHPGGIAVVDPHAAEAFADFAAFEKYHYMPDVTVFAVKPQALEDVLPQYRKLMAHSRSLVISIAAGKNIAYFQKHFRGAAIVRAMPNTPAAIGKGMTVLCADGRLSAAHRALATALFGAVGQTAWVDEDKMHAATAISGSGPAYIFYLLEQRTGRGGAFSSDDGPMLARALAHAGIGLGLEEALARLLADATVEGSVALAGVSKESLEQLRRNVTSPGGVTEAALKVLMSDRAALTSETALTRLIRKATQAAAEHSRLMAG